MFPCTCFVHLLCCFVCVCPSYVIHKTNVTREATLDNQKNLDDGGRDNGGRDNGGLIVFFCFPDVTHGLIEANLLFVC